MVLWDPAEELCRGQSPAQLDTVCSAEGTKLDKTGLPPKPVSVACYPCLAPAPVLWCLQRPNTGKLLQPLAYKCPPYNPKLVHASRGGETPQGCTRGTREDGPWRADIRPGNVSRPAAATHSISQA